MIDPIYCKVHPHVAGAKGAGNKISAKFEFVALRLNFINLDGGW
jgi:hypothetical protein